MPKLPKNLEELAESLSPERQKFLSLVSGKRWFQRTDFEIQKKVFNLPSDFDGFLSDFSQRKDEYGGLNVLKLLDILPANYNLIALYKVRSNNTNQEFTYEYVSSKYVKTPATAALSFLRLGAR